MGVLTQNSATLIEIAKRLDPGGKTPLIAELLSQSNEILLDMRWKEGNLPTGNRSTMRTGLPAASWRLFNQGIIPSKSTTAQIDDATGMLESWSEVDCKLAELNGNVGAFRASEATAFIESMNQEMASTIFYGNVGVAPEEFTGLAARYASIAGATNASNILSGGGTSSDNLSIWLIAWGDNTVFGIYPKASKAGLVHEDLGIDTIQSAGGVAGARMRAYQERWEWDAGIVVKDWRYAVRICNIDVSALNSGSGAANITQLMIQALHRLPTMTLGTPVFYANRTGIEWLDIQGRNDVKSGGQLKYEDVDGRPRLTFRGYPVRRVDALLETEAEVV